MDNSNFTMVGKYMDLRVDWAFKYIFSIKEHLLKFLNDILPTKVDDLEYLPNAIPVRSEKDKRSSLDVICKGPDGSFLVEMQRRPEDDFDDRLAYYAANLITSQVKRKEEIYDVSKVYVLCVAGYRRKHPAGTPKDKVLFRYDFIEDETHERYDGSRLSYYYLELARFTKTDWDKLSENTQRWCYMFKKMHTFASRTPLPGNLHGFEDIVEDAKLDALTDEQRINYKDAMINQHQLLSTRLAAYHSGEKFGIKKGIMQGKAEEAVARSKEIARNLLSEGIEADTVARCTGLSKEEVQKLAASQL